MKKVMLFCSVFAVCLLQGCDKMDASRSADDVQSAAQEKLNHQAVATVGMPAVKNFFMKRELKEIIEKCDDPQYVTYTYIVAENTGKLIFLGRSIGYGIPAATQYTNPTYLAYTGYNVGVGTLAQADPDGLYKPSSAEGTWVLLLDPKGKDVKPLYVEPRIIVSPFPLENK